jgi:hypothetical protein
MSLHGSKFASAVFAACVLLWQPTVASACDGEPPPDRSVQVEPPPLGRAGEIIIIGNTATRFDVIRDQLPFMVGWKITEEDLFQAERRLARLNRFVIDPARGIRPRVKVLKADAVNQFKTVVVVVEERPFNVLFYECWERPLEVATRECTEVVLRWESCNQLPVLTKDHILFKFLVVTVCRITGSPLMGTR